MKKIAIIPARYSSTRFPGKPLALLAAKPVIQHVYEKVSQIISETWVATDDERIFNKVKEFGGKAVMTRANHQSGTDRIQEAVSHIKTDAEIIINIQGDEPFVQHSQINTLCKLFEDPDTQIGTIGKVFSDIEAVENPNSPKVIIDNHQFAMYFSRSPIPFIRGVEKKDWISHYPFLKHIGIYAYRKNVLEKITQLPQSSLEIAESLEQLRWVQNGYKIKVGFTDVETIGIDTPAELEKAEQYLRSHPTDM